MTQPRRIALKLPESEVFQYPIEGGPKDCDSYYHHGKKYPNGGFTGQRWVMIGGHPHLFRADDHDQRFQETIEAVEWLDMGCTQAERREACYRLIAMNPGDCYLSQMFNSRGDVGVYPGSNRAEVLINTRAFDEDHPYLPKRVIVEGMNARITEPDIHRGPYDRFSRAKLGRNYLFSNIAKHRAKQTGLDDGIMLDEHGFVSELSVSNVMLLEDRRLISPWELSSPLNGITKRTTATIAETFDLEYAEEQVPINRLRTIRGALATGTAIGDILIRRFVHWNGSLIWELTDSDAEKLLRRIMQRYLHVLNGGEPGYHPEWFTSVPKEILRLPEPLVHARV